MKICIAGYGSIGRRHHRILSQDIFKDKQVEFALCDIGAEYLSVDEVCSESFDIVAICTPSADHIKTAKKFVNAKSFFIEKPLDSDTDLIRSSLEFFKNKKTMVACNLFFSKHMEKIKKDLPRARLATIKYHSYLPMWREDNGYLNLYSRYKAQGGGILLDAIHELHYPIQILGYPEKVIMNQYRITDFTKDTDDVAKISLIYSDKIVDIELSYLCKNKHRYCDMILQDGNRSFVDFTDGLDLEKMNTISDLDEMYTNQWRYFIKEDKPINSYKENLKMLEFIEQNAIENF